MPETQNRLLIKYQNALTFNGMGLWEFDVGNRIFKWDTGFHQLLEFSIEKYECSLEEWFELVQTKDQSQMSKFIFNTMSAETDVNTYFRISTKQGKTKYIRSSGKKIIADDKLVGYLGLAWDVTSEVLMQKSLVAQSRMATLGEMAAGIAHEINNPLTIVQGKTLILLDKIEQKKFDFQSCRHDLLQIEQNCIRIDRIMKSFKSVSSKIDEEPFELSDLSTIIQQAIDIVKEKFSSKNVKISYKKESIPKDISVQVRPSEIIQVLLNLITNGFDAVENQKDGWVEVGINFSKGVYQVEILDSGSEIDLEVVRHMMEPFFTTKPSGQGTGLGLAIARQIVQNHRGELFYDAASLHTRFVFTLPASL